MLNENILSILFHQSSLKNTSIPIPKPKTNMSAYLDLLFPPSGKKAILKQLASKDDDDDQTVKLVIVDDDGGCCGRTFLKVIQLAYGTITSDQDIIFIHISPKLDLLTVNWNAVAECWPNVTAMGKQDVTMYMEMETESGKISHYVFVRMKTHDEREQIEVEQDVVSSLKALVEEQRTQE